MSVEVEFLNRPGVKGGFTNEKGEFEILVDSYEGDEYDFSI